MRPRAGSRRRWTGIIAMAVTALLAGLAPAAPASAQDYPEGILPPGDWTEEQANELLRMVSEAEEKLPATFPTGVSEAEVKAVLEPLGFVDIGPVVAGYSHYVNISWFDDDHLFDPEYAESLVYRRASDGTETIAAAMYFHNIGTTMDNIPEDQQWLPGWHTHPELCSDEQGRVVGFNGGGGECPPGSAPGDGPPMIHTWIVDNECGHRFGGLGVGGFHCDYEDHGGEEHGDDHGDGEEGSQVGQPAPAVSGSPGFTG